MKTDIRVAVNVIKKTGQKKHYCYIPKYIVLKEQLTAGDRVSISRMDPVKPAEPRDPSTLTSIEKPVSLQEE